MEQYFYVPNDALNGTSSDYDIHPDNRHVPQELSFFTEPSLGMPSVDPRAYPSPYPSPAHHDAPMPGSDHFDSRGVQDFAQHNPPAEAYFPPPIRGHIPQPVSDNSPRPLDQATQLEVLRETRRIRELELQIAEEQRRHSEERRKEREAELALAEIHLRATSAPHVTSSSTPQQFDWLNPLMEDLFGFGTPSTLVPSTSQIPLPSYLPMETSTLYESTTLNIAPQPSEVSAPSATNLGGKKKTIRLVKEHQAHCASCHKLMCHLQLRGERSELDVRYDMSYQCDECLPLQSTQSSRKRTNQVEDTALPTVCTVCTRVQGHGGFIARDKVPLMFTVEVICIPCSEKYKRCSNCGGGSTKGGIGKWRCKELFDDNRKTCRLSHARLGARDMELSVWEIPQDVAGKKELPALQEACEQMRREHFYAKLAVPEVLEHQDAIRTFADIEEKIIKHEFPARHLWTDPPQSAGHHIYVALTWTKARARRDKSKPEWTQSSKEEKSMDEWVAYNTRRSNVLMPANSILCGAWITEWVVPDRTLLMGTILPFDYGDVEDRSTFSYGEILQRILNEIMQHNADFPNDPWHPPEHLWAAIKSSPYTLRQRLMETLKRRLGFIPIEEYLTRYPDTTRRMFSAEASSIARSVDRRLVVDEELSVMARYLGKAITLEGLERMRARHLNKTPRIMEAASSE